MVGFVGARLLYVITQADHFASHPMDAFRVWEGGLVFFGGPLAVIPFVAWYVRRHKLALWRTMDCMIPGLVIAHAFGRLGCIAAGCCYGKPTGGDWGFRFSSELVDPALRGIYLHPTQLYESTALFLLFLGLLSVFRRKLFDGQVVLTYFMVYPVIRSIIEIYRGDQVRGFVIDGVLSTSQFISVLVFLGAAVFLARRLKQVKA
jgi:phosphatidylglycerol:prolipoprotein diacylglycerol transferase